MVSKSFCEWMSQRTNLEKTLLSISIIFFLTLVLLILIGIVNRGSTIEAEETICNSKDCIRTAGEMLGMMDAQVDPCQDFYSFACGGYSHCPSATSIAQTSADAVWAQLKSELESPSTKKSSSIGKSKDLYKICMSSRSYPKDPKMSLGNLMTEAGIGIWPAIDTFWDDSEATLEERLTALSLLGIDVAFRVEIVPDSQKPGTYINKIFPGGPLRGTEDMRKNPNFQSYLTKVLVLLGLSEFKASTEITDILSVEAHLNVLQKNVGCGPPDYKETLTSEESLKEMNRLMPGADWNVIMRELWKAANMSGPFTVEIYCRDRIKDYIRYLSELEPKSVYNYLGWRFLTHFSSDLGPAFRNLQLDYDTDEDGSVKPLYKLQWRHCLSTLERYVAPILAETLTSKDMDQHVMQEVETMEQNAKTTLKDFISSSSWLNETLDSRIKQKVAKVKFQVPSWNTTNLQHWFSQLDVDDNLFVRNIVRLQRLKVIQELRQSVTGYHIEFGDFELISPKTFSYKDNELGLYLDKIRKPYFRKDQPSPLKYAGLGTFLSEQLSRFLLEQNTGASGQHPVLFWQLWNNSKTSSSCFLNQFPQYFMSDRHGKEFILKNVFVDYNALQLSHSLFKSSEEKDQSLPGFELTSDQMYFLAYSQMFCEEQKPTGDTITISTKTRINSALRNLKQFSTAYSCDASTYMNPLQQCQLWR